MRRILLFVAFFAGYSHSFAQAPTLQQKLYYTCKVWGFVKYYHSNVSTCGVNWDSVLVSVLPAVRSASTAGQFNDALDTMLAAAGPMTLSTTYFPDTLPAELKRNRDWSWISDPVLRTDVQVQLDTIKNNFRPHAECHVMDDTSYTRTLYNAWGGYLEFPPDTLMLPVNTYSSYPDTDHRLLMFFKYWNIVRYFNPYNYVIDIPWDTTLYSYAPLIAAAPNPATLANYYQKLAARLDDAHVFGLSYSYYFQRPPGYYPPPVMLNYIGGQYVAVRSAVAGINAGDVLVSCDGFTGTQWEDSLRPYYSSGNISVFRRCVCENMLSRATTGISETLVFADSSGTNHTFMVNTANPSSYSSVFGSYFYPNDSLNSINWNKMACGTGYVNIGNISMAGVDSAYTALRTAPAIIFDIRNYPVTNSAWSLADLMYAGPMEFAKLTIPDVTYPGTYSWSHDVLGVPGNPTPYTGKVIVLVNQETQSAAEFSTMILRKMPGSIVIGSQTAGADGNITWLQPCEDMRFGWTSLGVFYPNGDSTQRIGMVPDSVVYPTIAGIRHHNDEVLNVALSIACSVAATPGVVNSSNLVSVYPNPTNGLVTIIAANLDADAAIIELSDITGRVIMSKIVAGNNRELTASFNIKALPGGMYFVTIRTDAGTYVRKVVKE